MRFGPSRILVGLVSITPAACYSRTEVTHVPQPVPVPAGELVTPGTAIWGRDSEFRIDAGVPFSTPFFADACVPGATTANYVTARSMGARPVVVQVPQLEQPLYGLLAFCRVPAEATGPATRSYELTVPPDRVTQTEGGRVSVEYELTNYQDAPAWQLWLSRSPALWQ